MLKIAKSRFYVVPVLMRMLDIVELLSRSSAPLKMNEISHAAGVSQTTTYRILRTLVHRGYLSQDLEGRFSMLNRPEMNSASPKHANKAYDEAMQSHKTALSGEEVIEILHRVLQTLRQGDEGNPDQDIVCGHARRRQRI